MTQEMQARNLEFGPSPDASKTMRRPLADRERLGSGDAPSRGNPSGPLNSEHPSLPLSLRNPETSTLMPRAFETSSALGAVGIEISPNAMAISWNRIVFKLRSWKNEEGPVRTLLRVHEHD